MSMMSEEHRKKLSEAMKGKNKAKKSEETKQKISEAMTGLPKGEEHKKKIGEGVKKNLEEKGIEAKSDS